MTVVPTALTALTAPTALARIHGRPAAGVPRWAMRTAYATALITVPSSVWRVAAFVVEAPLVRRTDGPPPGHGPILFEGVGYIVGLSLLSEVLAFLALGLVCRWGEVWPRWVPGAGGRPLPVLAAVVPAGLGAAALLVLPYALAVIASGRMLNGMPAGPIAQGWQVPVFWAAYLPLAAWGPLLGVLTVHYYRRRRAAA